MHAYTTVSIDRLSGEFQFQVCKLFLTCDSLEVCTCVKHAIYWCSDSPVKNFRVAPEMQQDYSRNHCEGFLIKVRFRSRGRDKAFNIASKFWDMIPN
jgi:hypothetical protein